MALLIRDKADQVKDRFVHSLLLPTVFRLVLELLSNIIESNVI